MPDFRTGKEKYHWYFVHAQAESVSMSIGELDVPEAVLKFAEMQSMLLGE